MFPLHADNGKGHIYAMESAAVQQRIQQQEEELQCKPTIPSLHL